MYIDPPVIISTISSILDSTDNDINHSIQEVIKNIRKIMYNNYKSHARPGTQLEFVFEYQRLQNEFRTPGIINQPIK